MEKRLFDDKETARKAARKLSDDARAQHAIDTATARAALEHAPIVLELPPPPPPPAPQTAVGRKRAAPPAPPPSDPHSLWEVHAHAWCKRRGLDDADLHALMQRKGEKAWAQRKWEQAWQPRTWRGRLELSQLRERGHARNRSVCTCDEGVPSWLCRAAWCYSFEAFGFCENDGLQWPGYSSCSCMIEAWGDEATGMWETQLPSLRERKFVSHDDAICFACPEDPAPVPPGGWPLVEPRSVRERRERAAAKALCKRHARVERMQRKIANC
jgi:hypothetical protein